MTSAKPIAATGKNTQNQYQVKTLNDASNRKGGPHAYRVSEAVAQGLDPSAFEFFGVFGCAALFRRTDEGG